MRLETKDEKEIPNNKRENSNEVYTFIFELHRPAREGKKAQDKKEWVTRESRECKNALRQGCL